MSSASRGSYMGHLRKIELPEIMPSLPDIDPLDVSQYLSDREDSLYLCALGFEDRCPWIPELLTASGSYRAEMAVYFEYSTNSTDNELNQSRLINAMNTFGARVKSLSCDSPDFPLRLRNTIRSICATKNDASVTFDISVCSSRVLLLTLKVLLESDVRLNLVYSEANLYHPTEAEYSANVNELRSGGEAGIAQGVSEVIPSPEFPGNRRDRLPEKIVVFPTYKPERTKAVITEVDPSLATRPQDRVIWLIGDPHLPEDHWRVGALKEINRIDSSIESVQLSTFNYKATLDALDRLYRKNDCKYHLTISPLGSKLQSVAVALFWYMRQDVSIVFSMPKRYNASQYSEGCKATWQINFGETRALRELLDEVGQLRIVNASHE
jgi:hypothetical protein